MMNNFKPKKNMCWKQLSNRSSDELLPKTNVIGFRMTNNFRVQSFSSCHTKFGVKFKFQMRPFTTFA